MNLVILIGNLATEPESRVTQNKVTVCTFRLAVQREYRNKESGEREADFLTVVAWRTLGETCAKYLHKGKQVAVFGHLENRSYDGKDGVKRTVTEVIAEKVKFLSPKAYGESEPGKHEEPYPDFPYQEGGELPYTCGPDFPY